MVKYLKTKEKMESSLAEAFRSNTDPRYNTLEKLAKDTKVRQLLSEDQVYDPQEVLSAAYELGLMITACSNCRQYQTQEEQWAIPEGSLVEKLKEYSNLSHTYCKPCLNKLFKL